MSHPSGQVMTKHDDCDDERTDHSYEEENMSGRKIRVGILFAVGFQLIVWGVGGVHGAEQFPTKPIRIICSQAAGSANDLVCRMLQDPLSKVLGVPVVVENKPGASGAIAGDYVAKSNPDGYTLLSDNAGLALIIPVTEPEQFPGRKDLSD